MKKVVIGLAAVLALMPGTAQATDKVDVCHNGQTINIAMIAWIVGHQFHEGDYLGECVVIPDPEVTPTPEPTVDPTPEPTQEPTPAPTEEPTPVPTNEPTPTVPPVVPEYRVICEGGITVTKLEGTFIPPWEFGPCPVVTIIVDPAPEIPETVTETLPPLIDTSVEAPAPAKAGMGVTANQGPLSAILGLVALLGTVALGRRSTQ